MFEELEGRGCVSLHQIHSEASLMTCTCLLKAVRLIFYTYIKCGFKTTNIEKRHNHSCVNLSDSFCYLHGQFRAKSQQWPTPSSELKKQHPDACCRTKNDLHQEHSKN